MPEVIDTPIPSLATVAKIMGVSKKRVKEIERMIDELPSVNRRRIPTRQAGNRRKSARPETGRRS